MNRFGTAKHVAQVLCWLAAELTCSTAFAAGFQLFYGPENSNTYASGVSGDGAVVVGQLSIPDSTEAFYASESTGLISLGDFPGGLAFATANAANQDGSVIVGLGYREEPGNPSGVQIAFRWTNPAGLVDLGDLEGGSILSFASGVSSVGLVIVGAGYPANNDFVAWRLEDGIFTSLGTFDSSTPQSTAQAVSGDGSIVVGSSRRTIGPLENTRAFRWTSESGLRDLGDLEGGSLYASAYAISRDGSVIVGSSSSHASTENSLEACRWSEDKIQGLGALETGSFASDALATNENGKVVVGRSVGDQDGNEEAFLWTEEKGMQRLTDLATAAGIDLGTAIPRQATGVSFDGTVIVGTAQTPQGATAFRLDLRDLPDAGQSDALADGQADAVAEAEIETDSQPETEPPDGEIDSQSETEPPDGEIETDSQPETDVLGDAPIDVVMDVETDTLVDVQPLDAPTEPVSDAPGDAEVDAADDAESDALADIRQPDAWMDASVLADTRQPDGPMDANVLADAHMSDANGAPSEVSGDNGGCDCTSTGGRKTSYGRLSALLLAACIGAAGRRSANRKRV